MKPFLLLSTRADEAAAAEEYAAFLRETGLTRTRLVRLGLDTAPLPALDLDEVAGIFLGGGPFNSSDPEDEKSPTQRRVERELAGLLDDVVARDLPFLGACYGVGTLGVHQGGVVDRTYAEPIGAVPVTLTEAGRADPLLRDLPGTFDAYVGHKEACRVLPPDAVLLASSPACPVQMFRVRQNLYATQFHPELDLAGIRSRVRVYQHAGYFAPHELDTVLARLDGTRVTQPPRILAAFARRYG